MNLCGFLFINKQQDWTSFDVCARVRRQLKTKRVGHTGTLDPFATGLLIVAVGRATKLIPFLEKAKKTYRTTISLGKITETLDTESAVIEQPLTKEIDACLLEKILKENFLGKISQIPPKYSALKINGQKMYDLARKGIDFEVKSRDTEIYDINLVKYDFPNITLDLTVAAGFYIRSFARDLGKAFGGGGYCVSLERTAIEGFFLENAIEIDEGGESSLIDPAKILTHIRQVEMPEGRMDDFKNGRAFKIDFGVEGELVLLLENGVSFGIGEVKCGNLCPKTLLR